ADTILYPGNSPQFAQTINDVNLSSGRDVPVYPNTESLRDGILRDRALNFRALKRMEISYSCSRAELASPGHFFQFEIHSCCPESIAKNRAISEHEVRQSLAPVLFRASKSRPE